MKKQILGQLGVILTPIAPPKNETLHPKPFVMGDGRVKIIIKSWKTNKSGFAPLALQTFINGEKVEVGLGISVKPEKWDKKHRYLIPEDQSDNLTNVLISRKIGLASDILSRLAIEDRILTKNEFIDRFKNPQSKEDFIPYFKKKADEKLAQNKIGDSTFEAHMVIYRKLQRFQPKWYFTEISTEFIREFEDWLRKDLKRASAQLGKPLQNNGNNTVAANLKLINTYLRAAIDDKIRFEMPKIKIKWQKTSRVALTKPERKRLIDLYKSNTLGDTTKQQALEMFLFSCNTGLRISDLKRLRKENIVDGCIKIIAHKTKKDNISLDIPLTPFTRNIVADRTGKIFPTVSEQTLNEKLKEIAFQVDINKNVTMHVGRHTFATLWLQESNDIKSLSDILGHSSITTTQQYLHKDLDHVKKAFAAMEKGWDED